MPADEAKLSATRSRPSPTFAPAPIPQSAPTSPWIPFMISFVLIAGAAGGLFYYMDEQFKKIEASILKTNDFVLDMNQRLKKIEGDIAASDAQANQEGSSLTSKMMNLESRLTSAEKNIGWNSSRVSKQVTDIENMQATVNDVSANVSSQSSKISANTAKITELANKEDGSAAVVELSQKIESNSQAIQTIDAHRTRLSDAIQKVQSDTARLIRLYEKDNPTAKRVQ